MSNFFNLFPRTLYKIDNFEYKVIIIILENKRKEKEKPVNIIFFHLWNRILFDLININIYVNVKLIGMDFAHQIVVSKPFG